MSDKKCYLAIDLGAGSGRALVGLYDGSTITLDEIHRFPSAATEIHGRLFWDVLGLWNEIKIGLRLAYQKYGDQLVSVGVDTWGVDYGLLDENGELLGNPICYRDARTDGMMEAAYERIPKEELYNASGTQLMFFNTVFQLYSEVAADYPRLRLAKQLLFMPDLINYWLSGKAVNEYTIASTSQLMDMRTGQWSDKIINALGMPRELFGEIVAPGTELGELIPEVAEDTLVKSPIKVVTVGSHDTASAVAAVPSTVENYAYMSSGTWSLMGIESKAPSISKQSFDLALTNEGGVDNTIRILKNITALWLLQECKRYWDSKGEELSFDDITRLAGEAPAFVAVIDTDHPSFASPGNMPERIDEYCRNTGQQVPENKGEILRVITESLALKYRLVIEQLDLLRGQRIEVLNVVGGGTQNQLLNQMTADAIGRPVVTGPVEATALGNILMQMVADGTIDSLEAGRAIVRQSTETETFEPTDSENWEAPFAKLLQLIADS